MRSIFFPGLGPEIRAFRTKYFGAIAEPLGNRASVTGECSHADAQRESDLRRRHVLGGESAHLAAREQRRPAGPKLMDFQRKRQRLLRRARVAGGPERVQPRPGPGRTAGQQGLGPLQPVDRIDQQERPAGDVIAVQVREVDGIQLAGIAAQPLQRHQGGGSEVHRAEAVLVLDQP